ncbi:MAG: hypothetical protein AAB573_02555 [Patescibacteria group bacterium]
MSDPIDTPRLFGYALAMIGLFAVLAYAAYLSAPLVRGPALTLTSPQDGDQVSGLTTIRGFVKRVSLLTINGLEVPLTEEGQFEVVRALAQGYTEVTVVARDRFNREVSVRAGVITTFNTPHGVQTESESTTSTSTSF